jgi:hypothetical protein
MQRILFLPDIRPDIWLGPDTGYPTGYLSGQIPYVFGKIQNSFFLKLNNYSLHQTLNKHDLVTKSIVGQIFVALFEEKKQVNH